MAGLFERLFLSLSITAFRSGISKPGKKVRCTKPKTESAFEICRDQLRERSQRYLDQVTLFVILKNVVINHNDMDGIEFIGRLSDR